MFYKKRIVALENEIVEIKSIIHKLQQKTCKHKWTFCTQVANNWCSYICTKCSESVFVPSDVLQKIVKKDNTNEIINKFFKD